ncbi:hypothetical protein BUALT_Bualt05G0103500 [Buddleja alternifolia]|uniref:Two-component response regulator n=1 Tax=Buddleja alternifolia TaxID=168488 RepID=A0AAV6XUA1_9LAMI|nr:hypothetical protein BUALT_Bualt05G0103500 [Buddleja alternifolia]
MENKDTPPDILASMIRSFVGAFQVAAVPIILREPSFDLTKWRPPDANFVKLNFDCAIFSEPPGTGFGVIAGDFEGHVLGWLRGRFDFESLAETREGFRTPMECTSSGKSEVAAVPEMFPAGLRVLVVDDDVLCLRVVEQMLRKCMYRVTSCTKATIALNLLRERKGCFDIVLSDVHMPDMNGFKLLELVGLEMDLPVIMMSADGRTNLVMRGIRHGACDYLIKPIRDEELKNIWQHVVRKRCNASKEHDHSSSMEDHDRQKGAIDDAEYASSVNEGTDDVLKTHKKRRDSNDEDDTELENDDSSMAKKPRVVWSVELHQQFVGAVNQLGIDKAVPKRILELMNVPGLTRENVASHLQKFRLYLKRLSGVAHQQGGFPPYCGPVEQNPELASLGRFDIQALAASGQLPPQTFAALHAELLSRPAGNLVFPAIDQPTLLHTSLQGSKSIPVDRNMPYSQPLTKCPSSITNQISQPIMSKGVETNNNMLISFIQQQQQRRHYQQEQQQKPSIVLEPSRSLNVQPSCLVVPSQSSANFQAGNSPVSVNQNSSLRNSMMDYNNSPLQSNNPSERKPACMLSDFAPAGSVSSVSSRPRNVQDNAFQRVPTSPSTFSAVMQVPNMHRMQGSYNGKGTLIPSRFAVDEYELSMDNASQVKIFAENNVNKVKQEPNMDFMENIRVGIEYGNTFPQMI